LDIDSRCNNGRETTSKTARPSAERRLKASCNIPLTIRAIANRSHLHHRMSMTRASYIRRRSRHIAICQACRYHLQLTAQNLNSWMQTIRKHPPAESNPLRACIYARKPRIPCPQVPTSGHLHTCPTIPKRDNVTQTPRHFKGVSHQRDDWEEPRVTPGTADSARAQSTIVAYRCIHYFTTRRPLQLECNV
jgi:hypothetical protein